MLLHLWFLMFWFGCGYRDWVCLMGLCWLLIIWDSWLAFGLLLFGLICLYTVCCLVVWLVNWLICLLFVSLSVCLLRWGFCFNWLLVLYLTWCFCLFGCVYGCYFIVMGCYFVLLLVLFWIWIRCLFCFIGWFVSCILFGVWMCRFDLLVCDLFSWFDLNTCCTWICGLFWIAYCGWSLFRLVIVSLRFLFWLLF